MDGKGSGHQLHSRAFFEWAGGGSNVFP